MTEARVSIDPPQVPAPGLRCPRCGNNTFWTCNTERLPGNRIRRYKSCRKCGRRITTFETTPGGGRGPDEIRG